MAIPLGDQPDNRIGSSWRHYIWHHLAFHHCGGGGIRELSISNTRTADPSLNPLSYCVSYIHYYFSFLTLFQTLGNSATLFRTNAPYYLHLPCRTNVTSFGKVSVRKLPCALAIDALCLRRTAIRLLVAFVRLVFPGRPVRLPPQHTYRSRKRHHLTYGVSCGFPGRHWTRLFMQ